MHGYNICQHNPMAITSAIIMWLPFTTVFIKMQDTLTPIPSRCWKLLRLTFSSDLRKPCCDLAKACLLLEKYSVLEKQIELCSAYTFYWIILLQCWYYVSDFLAWSMTLLLIYFIWPFLTSPHKWAYFILLFGDK